MTDQFQIKISVSKRLYNLIDERANKLGVKKASYCYNIIFEHLRKEVENG